MINIFNPFEEKYFNKKSIANKDDKNVVMRPTKRGKKPNEKKSLKEEINSTIAAREIAEKKISRHLLFPILILKR